MENNNQNPPRDPFFEFLNSFNAAGSQGAGVGVDHSNTGAQAHPAFPFNAAQFGPWIGQGWSPWAGPWAGHGWHGRHGHHHQRGGHDSEREGDGDDHDMESSPETMTEPVDTPGSEVPPPPPPPPGGFPAGSFPHHPPPPPPPGNPHFRSHFPPHHGPGSFHAHRGRGGRCGRGGRRGMPPPPPPPYNGPFDFQPLMRALSTHPLAQAFRQCMDQSRAVPSDEPNEPDNSFVPPVDVFNTEKAYVLHVSLPGAAKEDISVSWDGDNVNIAGVVYRPGNEEFLQSLASSERKVGMFEKSIKLPPIGSENKDEVDGFSITAKMENGILIVTVPKTDKEWTEIHHVDIE
ncbi:HSP20-like chaperone [Whalleya microplaca]|nr:HSP20-like chaperone [Whalleya microplaca]